MDNDSIIEQLKGKTFKNTLDDSLDRELLLSSKVNLNDIFVGCVLNKVIEKNIYEVYVYIKTVNEIACPFNYYIFSSEIDAENEYFKNKNFIESTNLDDIIKAFI
jgi:hypothetical protein